MKYVFIQNFISNTSIFTKNFNTVFIKFFYHFNIMNHNVLTIYGITISVEKYNKLITFLDM
jgi:hypothetical protein